jgi:hypothetical protein
MSLETGRFAFAMILRSGVTAGCAVAQNFVRMAERQP